MLALQAGGVHKTGGNPLHSASINIFNGMLSLAFSCDGTHYMSWQEFLDKDMMFWPGSAA